MDSESRKMQGIVLSIVVIGIILVIGITILSSIETATLTAGTAGAAVNESVASSKTVGLSATLSAAGLVAGSCGTITQVLNGTVDGTNIALGNFTQTGCAVVNTSSMATFHTALLFSYPYTYSAATNASSAANATVVALSNGTPWLTILIVVAFAVIVLGFLTSGFNQSNRNEMVY